MTAFLYTYALPTLLGLICLAGVVLGLARAIFMGKGWPDYDDTQQEAEAAEALEKQRWNKRHSS